MKLQTKLNIWWVALMPVWTVLWIIGIGGLIVSHSSEWVVDTVYAVNFWLRRSIYRRYGLAK